MAEKSPFRTRLDFLRRAAGVFHQPDSDSKMPPRKWPGLHFCAGATSNFCLYEIASFVFIADSQSNTASDEISDDESAGEEIPFKTVNKAATSDDEDEDDESGDDEEEDVYVGVNRIYI